MNVRASLIGVHLPLVVDSFDRVSRVWCMISDRWKTLKPISDNLRRHRSGLPIAFAIFSVHFTTVWSVSKMERVPSRYGQRSNAGQTMVRDACLEVSYTWSAPFSDYESYPVGLSCRQAASGGFRVQFVDCSVRVLCISALRLWSCEHQSWIMLFL